MIWPDTTSNTLAFLQHPNPPRPHCLPHSFQRLQELPPSRANPWRCCRLVRNHCCSAPAGQAAGRNCFCWGWKFTFQAGGIPKSQAVPQSFTSRVIKSEDCNLILINGSSLAPPILSYTNLDLHILSTCPKATYPSHQAPIPSVPSCSPPWGARPVWSMPPASGGRSLKVHLKNPVGASLMFPDSRKI